MANWRGTGKMFFSSITLFVSWLLLDRAIIFCLWNHNFPIIYLATFLTICTSSFWSGHEVGPILPPPGEQSEACTSLLPLTHFVFLSFQGCGSSWVHWVLLASCVLLQNQNLSVLLLGRPLGLSLHCQERLMFPGNVCLPAGSLHFHSWLPWIGEKSLLASS